jgi:hypothetical protein
MLIASERPRAKPSQLGSSCEFLTQKELDPDAVAFNSQNNRYHFPFRFYLPFRGVFAQTDPLIRIIRQPKALPRNNRLFTLKSFLALEANPVRFSDPLGLDICDDFLVACTASCIPPKTPGYLTAACLAACTAIFLGCKGAMNCREQPPGTPGPSYPGGGPLPPPSPGPGPFPPSAPGGEGGEIYVPTTLAGLALVAAAASIAVAIVTITEATKPPNVPRPLPPLGCVPTGGLIGGTVQAGASSCKEAVEKASLEASRNCFSNTRCNGNCQSGRPCKPYTSITNTNADGWLFYCWANVEYQCGCGCS